MECIYNPIEDKGQVSLSNLDYSSIVAGYYVNPAVWFKYLHIARDWIFEQKYKAYPDLVHLRTVRFKVDFTSAAANLFDIGNTDHYSQYMAFMANSFKIDCNVIRDNGMYADFELIVKNAKTNVVIANAVSTAVTNGSEQGFLHTNSNMANFPNVVKTNCYKYSFIIPRFEVLDSDNSAVSLFIGMCHNCGDEAVRRGLVSFLKGSICRYYPTTIGVNLCNVAPLYVQTDVFMWADEKVLHFQIKQNGAVLCYISMSYMGHPTANL